ncbi:MAG: 30S ribosomal protein S20 [Patescibacteria group bacterium]
MAITSSAKKAIRVSARKAVFNVRRADAVRKVTKEIKQILASKNVKDAKALMAKAYKAIDKATKMNTIHKNTASRKKAQIAKWLKAAK